MFQASRHFIPDHVINRLHHKIMALQYHSEAFSTRLPKTRLLFADQHHMLLISTNATSLTGAVYSTTDQKREFEIPDYTTVPNWAIAGTDSFVLGSSKPKALQYVYAKSFKSGQEFSSIGRPYIVKSDAGVLDIFAVEDERHTRRLDAYRSMSLNLHSGDLVFQPQFVPQSFADQLFWYQTAQNSLFFPSQLLHSQDFRELYFRFIFVEHLIHGPLSLASTSFRLHCGFERLNHAISNLAAQPIPASALIDPDIMLVPYLQEIRDIFFSEIMEVVDGLSASQDPDQVWDFLMTRPELISQLRPFFGTTHVDRLVDVIRRPTSRSLL